MLNKIYSFLTLVLIFLILACNKDDRAGGVNGIPSVTPMNTVMSTPNSKARLNPEVVNDMTHDDIGDADERSVSPPSQ